MMQQKTSIRRRLLAWFRKNARDLPWRRTRDPYCIWLSEIMLQQTRVEQGLPYYERFLDWFPNVESLAAAHEEAVLKVWEGLGYYSRARNLHAAARVISEKCGGHFPETAAEWQCLPGVGRYTAGAIASIAFGECAPVLDGNVKRVLSRLFDIADCIDTPETERRLWSLAEELVPVRNPGDFNQAMMELGARICMPRNPRCEECPVAAQCAAYSKDVQGKRPVRRERKAVPHQDIVIAVIVKRGKFLLGKRPPGGLLGGLWEFPGGKIEAGETHCEALLREAREELGIKVSVGPPIATVSHVYSHLKVTLHVYLCEHVSGVPKPKVHEQIKWISFADLKKYPLPGANHRFLEALGEKLSSRAGMPRGRTQERTNTDRHRRTRADMDPVARRPR